MKKKWLMLILTAVLALSLTACGGKKNDGAVQEETVVEETAVDESIAEEEAAVEEAEENDAAGDETAAEENGAAGEDAGVAENGAAVGDTLGQTLLAVFESAVGENAESSAQELADAVMSSEAILFSGATMPVEAGLLTGFGETEISGFKEGVMFAPMIGTIPFVGYVFELEDGADVDAFMQTLTDNADPRWNICTEAEETVVESAGNKVFFLMCPRSLEE